MEDVGKTAMKKNPIPWSQNSNSLMSKQHRPVSFAQSQRKKAFELGNKCTRDKTGNLPSPQVPNL